MLVSVALIAVFVPFGRAIKADPIVPRGRFVNFIESILFFLRDEVARPFLGKSGDKFMPVIWTIFFYILFCNLLGLLPAVPPFMVPVESHGTVHWSWFGMVTPTGHLAVTATLALIAGLWWHCLGIREQGLLAYIKNIVPGGLPLWLVPPLFVIEALGHVIKVVALAVRLWANMMGGHTVMFVVFGMIFMFGPWAALGAVPAGVAIYMLEIFVAFLQAYVFTFLTVVFLGMALHPDH
jgi:F-type H+-transporting ATPase subunit a